MVISGPNVVRTTPNAHGVVVSLSAGTLDLMVPREDVGATINKSDNFYQLLGERGKATKKTASMHMSQNVGKEDEGKKM